MARKKKTADRSKRATITPTQGQYLAYIHLYRKLNRCSPAEIDIARYFCVSPPSAHQMIVKLEEKGLITRQPGEPRSILLAVPKSEIPELIDTEEETTLARAPVRPKIVGRPQLYTLCVFLIDSPNQDNLEGGEISRTIKIRSDQTLDDLHESIFDAFDRHDEHFYEFQFGSSPHDRKAKRYVLPEVIAQDGQDPDVAGDLTETTLDSLGPKVGRKFFYWFDYGDDWWHQINVGAIDEEVPRGKFPKVTHRVGKSPPQYEEYDEDYD